MHPDSSQIPQHSLSICLQSSTASWDVHLVFAVQPPPPGPPQGKDPTELISDPCVWPRTGHQDSW